MTKRKFEIEIEEHASEIIGAISEEELKETLNEILPDYESACIFVKEIK